MSKKNICSYDIDGVLYNGPNSPSLRPGTNQDVIITGRSIDEKTETYEFLDSRKITNLVFFNYTPFDKKTRDGSGKHKADIINFYNCTSGTNRIVIHYEDDPVQAEIIQKLCPDVTVILLNNPLVELSNRRNLDWNKQ